MNRYTMLHPDNGTLALKRHELSNHENNEGNLNVYYQLKEG